MSIQSSLIDIIQYQLINKNDLLSQNNMGRRGLRPYCKRPPEGSQGTELWSQYQLLYCPSLFLRPCLQTKRNKFECTSRLYSYVEAILFAIFILTSRAMKQLCGFGGQPRRIISCTHHKTAFCYAIIRVKQQQSSSLHLEESNCHSCDVKPGKRVYQSVAIWLPGSKPSKRCHLKSVRHYEGRMIET